MLDQQSSRPQADRMLRVCGGADQHVAWPYCWVFAGILRRDSLSVRQFAEVLGRMPDPEAVRIGVARAEADFAAVYWRQVVNRLDRLELFGLTVSESGRGYSLSTGVHLACGQRRHLAR